MRQNPPNQTVPPLPSQMEGSQPPDFDSLDKKVLANLRELSDEGEDFVGEVIDTFLANVKPLLVNLLGAIEKKNCIEMEKTTHKLKGSCGAIGAKKMMMMCSDIEMKAKMGDCLSANLDFQLLQEEFSLVCQYLELERPK